MPLLQIVKFSTSLKTQRQAYKVQRKFIFMTFLIILQKIWKNVINTYRIVFYSRKKSTDYIGYSTIWEDLVLKDRHYKQVTFLTLQHKINLAQIIRKVA